jgi:hypothetical protein
MLVTKANTIFLDNLRIILNTNRYHDSSRPLTGPDLAQYYDKRSQVARQTTYRRY